MLASVIITVHPNANLSLVCTTVCYSFMLLLLYAELHCCLLLSSRCILNMKRLVILKYKQKKKHWSVKCRITKWTEFQENEVGTK